MKRLTALVIFLFAAHAFAAIHVQKAVAGLDGYVRTDRWVPVVLYLNSDTNFQGTIEVKKGDTAFRKSLDLAAGVTKRVEVEIYFSNFYEPLTYSISSGLVEVLKNKLDQRLLNYQDNLVLVVSRSEYNHQFMNGEQNPWGGKTFVVYVKPEDLFSEWIAFSAVDAVALGSLNPAQLSDQTWKALLQYIASGGTLALSAGSDLAILQDPMLRWSLPEITPQQDLATNADFLMSYWPATPPTAFPQVNIPMQRVVARGQDRPLVRSAAQTSVVTNSAYYKGNIIYFAFDYTRLPDSIRSTFARFWNDTVFPSDPNPPGFGAPFRPRLEDNPRVQRSLYDIPALHLPEMKWFALFFFIYFCAAGPLQFLLVRSLKNNSVLWITFPATILIFSVLSFGYSEVRHLRKGKITQVAVNEVYPGLNQQITYQVYGTAMDQSGTFDFQAVPENSYLRKFVQSAITYQPEPYTVSEDLPRTLLGETLKNWTFRTFDAISSEPVQIKVHVKTELQGAQLKATVQNGMDSTLSDAMFIYDSKNAIALPQIAQNSNYSFVLPLTNTSTIPYAERQLKDLLDLYTPSYSQPHFFFAKVTNATGEITINGEKKGTACTRYIAVFIQVEGAGPTNNWTSVPTFEPQRLYR